MDKIEAAHRKYPEFNSVILATLPLLVMVKFSKVKNNKAKTEEITSNKTATFFFFLHSKIKPMKYNGLANQIKPSGILRQKNASSQRVKLNMRDI